MEQTWRWFGPSDPISLDQIRQSGATGIVSAIHENYRGAAWTEDEVLDRKNRIESAGLAWSVVESIPVTDAVKMRTADWDRDIEAYRTTLRRVARAGIKTICYNFMPVVDWTRTDLSYRLDSGSAALRFDLAEFAAYDAFILKRPGARDDYSPDILERAERLAGEFSDTDIARLETTIIQGLPGGEGGHDREGIAMLIQGYAEIDDDTYRANLVAFLEAVVPVAAEEGARLGIHPDDPPFSLFGLPRVVSTIDDCKILLDAVPDRANGITFCAGSFGSRSDNDLVAMARLLAPRVNFAHLRLVTLEPDGSFYEDEHLRAESALVDLVRILMAEEARRAESGDQTAPIPMRPDHGALFDGDEAHASQPGYSWIGRLKGLAELRGVAQSVDRFGLADPTLIDPHYAVA
ncbi:MAG: mannonate dehydratase [Pseudomonadota bacterium]